MCCGNVNLRIGVPANVVDDAFLPSFKLTVFDSTQIGSFLFARLDHHNFPVVKAILALLIEQFLGLLTNGRAISPLP